MKKNSVKHLTKQFLNQHSHFSVVWKYLGDSQKNKVLQIIAEGKGIAPNEKIVDLNSMFLTPENFFLLFKKQILQRFEAKSSER